MVGEFPELQGLMGGYYATAQGEDPQVAAAIRDHYKPVGQGDDVPTDPVTVAVSLADKLDTLVGFFLVKERPSGSRDPFALRRAALGVISLIIDRGLRFRIGKASAYAAGYIAVQHLQVTLDEYVELKARYPHFTAAQINDVFYGEAEARGKPIGFRLDADGLDGVLDFFADRLKVQQREAGVRHDLIDAVFALGGEDDLVRLLARVHALQAFVATADGVNLLAGYKRAANILKKDRAPADAGVQGSEALSDPGLLPSQEHGTPETALPYTPEPAEAALIAALDSAEPRAASAVAAEDFAGAMAALASLRAPIDAFFDGVTVNDPDPAKRSARLALLERVRAAVHNVADFSRVEG